MYGAEAQAVALGTEAAATAAAATVRILQHRCVFGHIC